MDDYMQCILYVWHRKVYLSEIYGIVCMAMSVIPMDGMCDLQGQVMGSHKVKARMSLGCMNWARISALNRMS